MNFIPGELSADGSFRTAGGAVFPLPPAGRAAGAALLGIRPEDMTRLEQSGQDRLLPISFQVRVIEPTGSEVQVIGAFEGAEIVAVLKGRAAPKPEEVAEFVFDPARVHLFERESGRRIN
jgi:multiple sugar transport system ATP-binding protein